MHWTGRITAAAIALLALGSIVAMVKASMLTGGLDGVASTAWRAAGYFTNLTALIVAFDLASVAVGWPIPARRAAGLVVWMVMIAAVYHLITPFWQVPAMTHAADVALHKALPLLVLLWWALYAPKCGLRPHMALGWLIWPLAYAAYVLARGVFTGFWPYPFADLDTLGPWRLSVNVAALCGGFLGFGLLVTVAAQTLQSRKPS